MARVLNYEIQNMKNATTPLIAKWLFILFYPNKIGLVIHMHTGFIMINGLMDLIPRFKGGCDFLWLWAFICITVPMMSLLAISNVYYDQEYIQEVFFVHFLDKLLLSNNYILMFMAVNTNTLLDLTQCEAYLF
jgi:hypothetical protein